jgi:hypothetical protein
LKLKITTCIQFWFVHKKSIKLRFLLDSLKLVSFSKNFLAQKIHSLGKRPSPISLF